MNLSQEQAERLNRGIDVFLQRLNQGLGPGYSPQDLPYRICKMEDHKIAFGISHRAPIGQKHPDGQKWKTYPGPWTDDCTLIVQTSRTAEEIATQFHRCTFDGIRPMHTRGGQLMDEATIDKIVSERVNERLRVLLDEKIAQLAHKQSSATRSETVPETDLQPRPVYTPSTMAQIEEVETEERKAWRPPPGMRKKIERTSEKMLATWTERAAALGMDPPKMAKGGRIDGRWMRFAQDKWRAHVAAIGADATGATP